MSDRIFNVAILNVELTGSYHNIDFSVTMSRDLWILAQVRIIDNSRM
jgi:hypothetical protein